jgi:hypothetical protein
MILDQEGVLEKLAGGIHWDTVVRGSEPPVPYAIMDDGGTGPDFLSSKSAHRTMTLNFRVYHVNPDEARMLAEDIANALEDSTIDLTPSPKDGRVPSIDRVGDVRVRKEDENVFAGRVSIAYKRVVPRTRP